MMHVHLSFKIPKKHRFSKGEPYELYFNNMRKKLTLSYVRYHISVPIQQGFVYVSKLTNGQREI